MKLLHGPQQSSVPTRVSELASAANTQHSLGALGERMAARYLEMRGVRILATNWRHKFGELDLVGLDGDTLVAIEVKTRSSTAFGHPLEAITSAKLGRIKALLAIWASAQDSRFSELRVDAIGIVLGGPGAISIDHRSGIA